MADTFTITDALKQEFLALGFVAVDGMSVYNSKDPEMFFLASIEPISETGPNANRHVDFLFMCSHPRPEHLSAIQCINVRLIGSGLPANIDLILPEITWWRGRPFPTREDIIIALLQKEGFLDKIEALRKSWPSPPR